MKQLFINMKTGEVTVEEVPPPVMKYDGVLVENRYSAVSGGTEQMLIQLASASYLDKARTRPDLFKAVVQMAKKQGPLTAFQATMGRMNKPETLGYSCAGIVREASPDSPFKPGDAVACGGAGYASHADMVFVPNNLCVRVPEGVHMRDAAFTTIGSIALQGVRNSNVKLGESVAVLGVGLIGQIASQLLKASGCRVFVIDLDRKKVDLAVEGGADAGGVIGDGSVEAQAEAFTGGNGFDAVIITAATKSKEPLETAGRIARHKGRVVLVGAVGMEIPRDQYYAKEIEFVISCSYGPGRYDPEYEEMGHDYPFGYVRWTENRNMEAFLQLLKEGKVRLDKVITHEIPFDDAPDAYRIISGEAKEPYLGIALRYAEEKRIKDKVKVGGKKRPRSAGDIGIGWVGTGLFATTTMLPNLKRIEGIHLVGVAAATGLSARSSAETYGFEYAVTDYRKLLEDPKVEAIVVTTRHSTHAEIVVEAVRSGKHVLVEKPLAVTKEELKAIIKAHKANPDVVIQVGFNRRYAPMTKRMMEFFRDRKGPMVINFRVNAGKVPKNHWIYERKEGMSRFVGEMCHFVDYLRFMVGCDIVEHSLFNSDHPGLGRKEALENVVMILKFEDGSIGTISYNTVGDTSASKEFVEVFADGSNAVLDDFRELTLTRNGRTRKVKDHLRTAKGHLEEISEFVRNIKGGKNPFHEYVETTRITTL
jgi:predicted dehydrogenase/threonine dehydrogenase-like Zn-dependent dehydrogenase